MKKLILFLLLIPNLLFSQEISYRDSMIRLKAPEGDWKVNIKYKSGKTIWKRKCYLSNDAILCLPFLKDLPKSEYLVIISRRVKRFKTKIYN